MGVFVCILNILLQYTTAMDRNELLLGALKSAFLAFGCFADFLRVDWSAVVDFRLFC